MAQTPIPIESISDPAKIRVQLLASGKAVHAPLNAVGASVLSPLNARLNDSSAVIGDPSKFWNGSYFGGGVGTGLVHRLNRLLVGEAAAGSSDVPQTTKDWLETLIANTVALAQLASVNAIGGLGVVGASRTSDYRTWAGAASGGAEGIVGIGWNDDTGAGTPIAVGADIRGLRKTGVNGITAGAQIAAANNGSTVDITPSGGVVSGSTMGLLLTNGPGPTGYTNPISAHIVLGTGTGTEVARKGIISLQTALDTALGSGGGGIALEMYRGQSVRWLNSGGTADAEMWSDASGLHLMNGNVIKGHTAALAINASSTIAGFQTHGVDAATGSWGVFCNQNSTVAPTVALVKSRGATVGSTTIVQSGDSLGNLTFRGYDGTNPIPGATISAAVDGTPGSSDMPGRLTISTTADGASAVTERVRVDSRGFVSITGSFGTGAPVTKTADFTVADTENSLINNKSGSSCTVTLPTASAWTGRKIRIKTIQAQTTVSASSNVVPLAGGAAGTAILAATAGKWADLESDGSNWIIMAAN
jgi:hypothetical protein